MATYCPNPACNRKLKLTDWKVNCPDCGTNIIYYKMDERLLRDADRVELEHVGFQKRVDRAKAACVGDNWAIARLVLLALPLLPLFLPLIKLSFNVPFLEKSESLSVIKIVMWFIDGLDFDVILGLFGTDSFGTAFTWFIAAILGLGLVIVAILAGLVTCFLAASPKGFARTVIISCLGIAAGALGMVAANKFGASMEAVMPGAIQSQAAWGGFVVIASFAIILGCGIFIKAKGGVPVKYTQCYVSGFLAEEVQEAIAAGRTLDEMRAERDAKEAAEAEAAKEEEPEAVTV